MKHRMNRRVVALVVVLAGLATLAPAALAPAADPAASPTLSLDQSAGTKAGSALNLGLDLKFADTGTDSPRELSIILPPGLLADASRDGGSCIKTANVSGTACEVGTGTVTATADPISGILNLPIPVSVPVTFYLVPPPVAGGLAGLAVEGLGEQIGSTGEIKLRPTGDPSGVGLSIDLVLPDQLPLTLPVVGKINTAQISLTEIQSTFDGLRYPATCPATPARVGVNTDSYSDATLHTVTAPLLVTGCSSLSFSPNFSATGARDTSDRQVRLATEVTQAADESPSRALSLAFPTATLAPNLQSIQSLCLNPASGTCSPVGSVSATSPLYPAALHGTAYLTGSPTGLSLTLVFPPPFPLTLAGAVDLAKNSARFTGLPDIPLTDLQVSLNAGPTGLFLSTCQTPTGTATALLTDQNGDKTVNAGSSFTVSGCPGNRRDPECVERVRRERRRHDPEQGRVLGPRRESSSAALQAPRRQARAENPVTHGRASPGPPVPVAPGQGALRGDADRSNDQVGVCLPRASDDPAQSRFQPHRSDQWHPVDREPLTRRQDEAGAHASPDGDRGQHPWSADGDPGAGE